MLGEFKRMRLFATVILSFASTAVIARDSVLAAALIQSSHSRSQRRAASTFLLQKKALPVQNTAANTMASLDSNHDGRVDTREVEAFSIAQGLDAASAVSEFSTLDTNHDGSLDTMELSGALGVSGDSTPAIVEPPRGPVVLPIAFPAPTQVVSSQAVSMAQHQDVTIRENQNTAKLAAEELVTDLSQERKAEADAEAFEKRAAELHANSTDLARSTKDRAMKASAIAASSKATELALAIKDLEEKAEDAEAEAASIHARAQAELQSAEDFVEVAHTTIQ